MPVTDISAYSCSKKPKVPQETKQNTLTVLYFAIRKQNLLSYTFGVRET